MCVYVKIHDKRNERDGRIAGQACRINMCGRSCLDFDFCRGGKNRNGSAESVWNVTMRASAVSPGHIVILYHTHGFVLLAV